MKWTAKRKLRAAIEAPLAPLLLRPDTRVIEREGWYQLVTPSAPGSMLNEVTVSRVPAEDAERTIDEVVAMYREHRHAAKWCVGPWTKPDDFGERLARRGFSSWDVRGMAVDTARSLPHSEGVVIEEIGEADLDRYLAAALRGWSIPADQTAADLEGHENALRARPRLAHFFAAIVDGDIAGTSALFLRGDYGYLVGAQVLPQHRGRGIYRALTATRLSFLAHRGIGLAVTHAREATSAPILDRLGFETVFRSKCYVLEPSEVNAPRR